MNDNREEDAVIPEGIFLAISTRAEKHCIGGFS